MINSSKSAEKYIRKNTNQLRLKLQNKDSKAETKFAKLLSKANIYFMRERKQITSLAQGGVSSIFGFQNCEYTSK